eukprot:gene1129-2658_t
MGPGALAAAWLLLAAAAVAAADQEREAWHVTVTRPDGSTALHGAVVFGPAGVTSGVEARVVPGGAVLDARHGGSLSVSVAGHASISVSVGSPADDGLFVGRGADWVSARGARAPATCAGHVRPPRAPHGLVVPARILADALADSVPWPRNLRTGPSPCPPVPGRLAPGASKLAQLAAAFQRPSTSGAGSHSSHSAPSRAAAQAAGSAAQCGALQDLYEGTQGARWAPGSSTGWLDGSDCCTWGRIIKCNPQGQDPVHPCVCAIPTQVTIFDALGLRMNGTLPGSLSMLTSLTQLNLDGNPNLRGPLPGDMGRMSNLTILYAQGSLLGGPLPDPLPPALEQLLLSVFTPVLLTQCGIGGTLPDSIGALVHLEVLSLPSNELHGTIPADIGLFLLRLTSFSISKNHITGTIPESITHLLDIGVIDLSENQLTGTLPAALGVLPSLYSLDVHQNMLEGTHIPGPFGRFQRRSTPLLDLSGTLLSGTFPGGLIVDAVIQCLTNWTQDPAACLQPSPSVIRLGGSNLWQCPLPLPGSNASLVLSPDTSCQDFEGALLRFYHDTGGPGWTRSAGWLDPRSSGVATICSWSGVRCDASVRVRQLGLENCGLAGTLGEALAGLSFLQTLVLSHNALSGPIPATIFQMAHLEGLDLEFNQLSGSLPAALSTAAKLHRLDLSDNALSGSVPPMCQTMLGNRSSRPGPSSDSQKTLPDSLIELDLSNNAFSGPFPDLITCHSLASLDLFNNQFEGSIDLGIGRMCLLSHVRLSNNAFTGFLDRVPGLAVACPVGVPLLQPAFPALVSFDISDNQASSSVFPSGLLALSLSLQLLDLSGSGFGGQLPMLAAGSASRLRVIDLSSNEFTGELSAIGNVSASGTLQVLDVRGNQLNSGSASIDWVLPASTLVLLASGNPFTGNLSSFFNTMDSACTFECSPGDSKETLFVESCSLTFVSSCHDYPVPTTTLVALVAGPLLLLLCISAVTVLVVCRYKHRAQLNVVLARTEILVAQEALLSANERADAAGQMAKVAQTELVQLEKLHQPIMCFS